MEEALTASLPAKPALVEDIDDGELVQLCKKELPYCTKSYELLVAKYEGIVYSTCYRMLGNREEAQEASQDALLRIFHKIHQFEGRSTFKTWLFRIVYNFCMTRRRKLATKRERTNVIGEEIIHLETIAHTTALGPDNNQSEYVHRALDQMRDEDREIITLRFISDLSLEEMASVLDLKLSATKMRLYRAMNKFKEVYKSMEAKRQSAER